MRNALLQIKIFWARRSDAFAAQLASVAAVTDSSLPDMRARGADYLGRDGKRRQGHYLPSAQVLEELTVLGPDLARLASDLRDRLSGPGDDRIDLASRPA